MYLVALAPVVAYGDIHAGMLPAELARRHPEAPDKVWIISMNLLVTLAVTLTFPVQFYPAIEVLEQLWVDRVSARRGKARITLGTRPSGGGDYQSLETDDDDDDLHRRQQQQRHGGHRGGGGGGGREAQGAEAMVRHRGCRRCCQMT
jgi:hypothetical protein